MGNATQNATAAAEAALSATANATTAVTEFAVKAADALTPAAEAAAGKARELQDAAVFQAKAVVGLSLDAYDRAVANYVDLTSKIVGLTDVEWVRELSARNAKAISDLSDVYSGAVRELIK
jgi:hypothetical protein